MKKKQKTRTDFTPSYEGEVVKLTWEDAMHCEEITERQLTKEPDLTFTSYGLVIKDDSVRLTIASTVANEKRDRQLREVTRVSWSLVREIKILEATKEL